MTDDYPRRTHEAPDSELGRLADAMLQLVHDLEDDDITAIVMLCKGDEGMTALGGYNEDGGDIEAASDLFIYLQKLMEANGKQMILMPMDGPSLS